MSSTYPAALDTLPTTHADGVGEKIHAVTINDLADAVNKIEAELGTTPKGSYADVSARLKNLFTAVNAKTQFNAKGDGVTDDYPALQAAATAASGGILFIPRGTYVLSQDVSIPSNTWVLGEGVGTVLLAKAGTRTNCLLVSGVSMVEISNLRIDGNKANVDTTGTAYQTVNCIRIANSTDVFVHHCWLENAYYSGIIAGDSDCRRLLFTNNRCRNSRDNQIFLRPGCAEAVIANNHCSGATYSGIGAIRSDHLSITGNVCSDNGPAGNGEGSGIVLAGCRYATITGNEVRNCTPQGIYVNYTTEGNWDPYGVAVVSPPQNRDSRYITIVGNTVWYDAAGANVNTTILIQVYNSLDCLVADNVLREGAIGVSVGTDVMTTTTNKNITIRGNHISGCKTQGINMNQAGTAGGLIVIEKNTFTELLSSCNGIFSNDPKVLIRDNVFNDNAGQGVVLGGGGTSSNPHILERNHFHNNINNGILVGSTTGNTDIIGNDFSGSSQQWGIFEQTASSGPCRILRNVFRPQGTNEYYLQNAASITRDNETVSTALRDKNQGAATISGASPQTIAHGLKATPNSATALLVTAGGISGLAISGVDATNITVTFTGTAASAVVNWSARL